MVIINELLDAPGDDSTTYMMSVGDTFIGNIETDGDRDWIGITLLNAFSYKITISGVSSGGGTLADPIGFTYLNGALWASDDNGGPGNDVDMTFIANNHTMQHYIDVGSAGDIGTGTYQVEVSLVEPAYVPVVEVTNSHEEFFGSSGPIILDYHAGFDAIQVRDVFGGMSGLNSFWEFLPNKQSLAFQFDSSVSANHRTVFEVHSDVMEIGGLYLANDAIRDVKANFTSAPGQTNGITFTDGAVISFGGEIVGPFGSVSTLPFNSQIIEARFGLDIGGVGDLTFKGPDGVSNVAIVGIVGGMSRLGTVNFEGNSFVQVFSNVASDLVLTDTSNLSLQSGEVSGRVDLFDDTSLRLQSGVFSGSAIHLHDNAFLHNPGPGVFGTVINANVFGDDNAQGMAFSTITGNVVLKGGADNVSVSTLMTGDIRVGAEDDDITIAGSQTGIIHTGSGADDVTVTGGVSGDIILGLGDDTLTGGGSSSLNVHGQGGADSITGSSADDTLLGGTEADSIDGGGGADSIAGGGGGDHLFGGLGADVLRGHSGGDELFGGDNNDTLIGNTGADTITGGDGADYLKGGKENDTLFGSEGDDTLVGGNGADLLYGGVGGSDVFVFSKRDHLGNGLVEANTIFEFDVGADKLDLSAIDADSITGGDQSFAVSVGAVFSGVAGELLLTTVGLATHVQGDLDGDSIADFVIVLDGVTGVTAGDVIA